MRTGGRLDRPAQRRGEGLLRRLGRQRVRLRPGRTADGVVVQGVRVDRRARAGHRSGLPGGQLTADGQRHQDHQRGGRGLRRLQYRRGAQAVVEHLLLPADAQVEERSGRRRGRRAPGRHRDELPGCPAHVVRGRQGRTAQQRNRVGPVSDPGDRHGVGIRHARGLRRLSPAALRAEGGQLRGRGVVRCHRPDNAGEQRIDKDVADNVTSAMQPIAAYSNGHTLAGGRPSAAKTGTTQLGDTDANQDAWMVGYTPSLSTAVWVGTSAATCRW